MALVPMYSRGLSVALALITLRCASAGSLTPSPRPWAAVAEAHSSTDRGPPARCPLAETRDTARLDVDEVLASADDRGGRVSVAGILHIAFEDVALYQPLSGASQTRPRAVWLELPADERRRLRPCTRASVVVTGVAHRGHLGHQGAFPVSISVDRIELSRVEFTP